jgi:hypothetical protein
MSLYPQEWSQSLLQYHGNGNGNPNGNREGNREKNKCENYKRTGHVKNDY